MLGGHSPDSLDGPDTQLELNSTWELSVQLGMTCFAGTPPLANRLCSGGPPVPESNAMHAERHDRQSVWTASTIVLSLGKSVDAHAACCEHICALRVTAAPQLQGLPEEMAEGT